MSTKPVLRRAQVQADVENAIAYYLEQGAQNAVEGFIAALEKAMEHIRRHPTSGSPRYAAELGLPDLRCWQVKRYPYLVFYVECENYVDIWRILHCQRDIPAWMREPE